MIKLIIVLTFVFFQPFGRHFGPDHFGEGIDALPVPFKAVKGPRQGRAVLAEPTGADFLPNVPNLSPLKQGAAGTIVGCKIDSLKKC